MANEYFFMTCDTCNISISIDDYAIHTRVCEENERLRELSHLIYNNSQVPTGNNLRHFVEDHFYVDNGRERDRIRRDSHSFIPVSLSSIKINAISSICFEKVDNIQAFECPICIEEVKEGDLRMLNICKHKFCSFCIKKWFSSNNTCPLCRKKY
jgi:hypothetical protein